MRIPDASLHSDLSALYLLSLNLMTSKQLILSAAILSLAITAAAVSYTKAADTNGIRPAMTEWFGKHFRAGKQINGNSDKIRKAIENDDYQAWADLMNKMPNADEFVNEETFAKLKEASELMQAGDNEAAKEIMDELGVNGLGIRMFGKRGEMNETFKQIQEAVENDDCDAWADLMEDAPNGSVEINRETFGKYVELNGVMRRAAELREELGMGRAGMIGGMGMGPGMGGWRGMGRVPAPSS
jgi:predicted  nucleic acid-binding Zn-ribbon protein